MIRKLKALQCVVEVSGERCWQWLFHGEAASLRFPAGSYDDVPASKRLAEADLKRLLRAPRAPANHRHLARMLTGVCADLNAAGQLVVMYGMLEANRIMEQFAAPPYRFEFERKLTDRPALVARYCRNLDGFARFLRERGELTDGDR